MSSPSFVIVEHQGQRERIAVARSARGVWVSWRGQVQLVETAAAGGHKRNEGSIEAPMTGRVVRVEVAAGDAVAADQVLVVLEAMKMEYRLTAPRAGTVEKVSCRAGELVDQGASLVTLTP